MYLVLQILVLGWIQFAVAARDCPDSWTIYKDSCYSMGTAKTTWVEANGLCKESDSHLVEVNTLDEYQFLDNFIHQLKASDDMWIGLSNMLGEWLWTTSLQNLTFSAWAPTEPDASDEHCAAVLPGDAHWYGHKCHHLHHFICEKRVGSSLIG